MCCFINFWTANICPVFDPVYGSIHKIQFLRLNINDDYNNDMNSVDIRDLITKQYRTNHYMKNKSCSGSSFGGVMLLLL